jgi:hypothetical protein
MGTSLKVHPTNGTDNDDQGLSARDRKQLDRLGKLWKSDAERGLKTRHRMGKVLNEQVGPPAMRKAHGRRVLEVYGAELGIAPSDLNRMGWFSHLFPDFSDLRTRHPEIDSWTRFKAELPSLKPAEGGKARQPVANPSNPALGGVARSFATLTSKLNGLEIRPVGAERKRLVAALQELAEAAWRRLKIRVEVAGGVNGRKPVVTKRSDRVARA